MMRRDWISLVWPGFLLACVLEVMVFAMVDPADLRWGSESMGLSRQGIQTIGFFLFWALGIASSALTLLFATGGPAWGARRDDPAAGGPMPGP